MNESFSPLIKFTGSIPKNYDSLLGPMFFEDYAIDLVGRIGTGHIDCALELCCGTGRVTRHLRKALPSSAKLIASDISPDMLSIAKQNITGDVEWMVIDAQKIPLDDNQVDLIVCSFGYMFMPNVVDALKDAHRVLRPKGKLLISTWDKLEFNGASNVHRKVIKKYFGDTLPSTYKLPFSMNEPDVIESQIREAGFSSVKVSHVKKNTFCATATEAARGLVEGSSIFNDIMKTNASWLEEIKSEVAEDLSRLYGSEPMVAPMSAFISEAEK
jgi:ubiquinone/menaquinone biosynthesis C-methylase UbiE